MKYGTLVPFVTLHENMKTLDTLNDAWPTSSQQLNRYQSVNMKVSADLQSFVMPEFHVDFELKSKGGMG